jgi:hypothetical protein
MCFVASKCESNDHFEVQLKEAEAQKYNARLY